MSSVLDMIGNLLGGGANTMAAAAQNQEADDSDVVVDAWKPRKRSFLEKLGDAVLVYDDEEPAFANATRERNMRSAMEGFTQDPINAIRRISQIDPKLALELHERYTDNSRQERSVKRQEQLFDFKLEEAVVDRVANAMGAATPETWAQMRQQMINYAKNKGVTLPYDIPEVYDENAINFIRYGELPIVKQEGFERADKRIAQGDVRLQQGERRLNETERHHYVQEGQAATNEAGRNRRTNQLEEGRNIRSKNPNVGPRFIGKPEFSPDKKKVRLKTKTGYEIYDISRGTDHARLIKKVEDE